MSDDLCFLPIRPPSPSLRSQILSLDVLAAQLSSLKRSVAWDTATSASFGAQNKESLAATGNIKINVGGEWWVDMTPAEGLAWIRRRKAGTLSGSISDGGMLMISVIRGTYTNSGDSEARRANYVPGTPICGSR